MLMDADAPPVRPDQPKLMISSPQVPLTSTPTSWPTPKLNKTVSRREMMENKRTRLRLLPSRSSLQL